MTTTHSIEINIGRASLKLFDGKSRRALQDIIMRGAEFVEAIATRRRAGGEAAPQARVQPKADKVTFDPNLAMACRAAQDLARQTWEALSTVQKEELSGCWRGRLKYFETWRADLAQRPWRADAAEQLKMAGLLVGDFRREKCPRITPWGQFVIMAGSPVR